MKYKLSKFQLFNIYCDARDCETCKFNTDNSDSCNKLFYEYIENEYKKFKVEDN